MEHSNRYNGIDPRAVNTVRFHARRLTRRRAVPGMEVEDYEQDLTLDLLHRLKKYDSSRSGIATFIDRVVRHRSASLGSVRNQLIDLRMSSA